MAEFQIHGKKTPPDFHGNTAHNIKSKNFNLSLEFFKVRLILMNFCAFPGKVEMITGVGHAMSPSLAQWSAPNRPIVASGVFGHFMVTPSSEALFVINGETRTVNCEIGGLAHPRALVWVTMQLQ